MMGVTGEALNLAWNGALGDLACCIAPCQCQSLLSVTLYDNPAHQSAGSQNMCRDNCDVHISSAQAFSVRLRASPAICHEAIA